MEFTANKVLFTREAVLLSVQRYLPTHFVAIEDAGEAWVIRFRPKSAGAADVAASEFGNEIIESAFRHRQAAETAELRRILLNRALAPYGKVE